MRRPVGDQRRRGPIDERLHGKKRGRGAGAGETSVGETGGGGALTSSMRRRARFSRCERANGSAISASPIKSSWDLSLSSSFT